MAFSLSSLGKINKSFIFFDSIPVPREKKNLLVGAATMSCRDPRSLVCCQTQDTPRSSLFTSLEGYSIHPDSSTSPCLRADRCTPAFSSSTIACLFCSLLFNTPLVPLSSHVFPTHRHPVQSSSLAFLLHQHQGTT